MEYTELANAAVKAKEKAIPPYSHFHVGAALLTEAGKIYEGANIESSSYSLTICAERTAAFGAVLAGERKFRAIAIAGDSEGFTPPCGACRQVLLELCGKDIDVILIDKKDNLKIFKLNDLIPFSFTEENLK
ncbi:cytidine deaminase [bacterium BMS3Abin04]|nr:cytidine deaminase [bacterium BMS3Abin04]